MPIKIARASSLEIQVLYLNDPKIASTLKVLFCGNIPECCVLSLSLKTEFVRTLENANLRGFIQRPLSSSLVV